MKLDIDRIDEVVRMARGWYRNNPCGGWLHIVLDDGNLSKGSVKWCLTAFKEKKPEDAADGIALAEALLSLSYREKIAVYKRYDEYAN